MINELLKKGIRSHHTRKKHVYLAGGNRLYYEGGSQYVIDPGATKNSIFNGIFESANGLVEKYGAKNGNGFEIPQNQNAFSVHPSFPNFKKPYDY